MRTRRYTCVFFTLAAALLLGYAAGVSAVETPSITSLQFIHAGTGERGISTVRVGFNFPGSNSGSCRRISFSLDGSYWFDASVPPVSSPSGTFDVNLPLYCNANGIKLGKGSSHTLSAQPYTGGFLCLPVEERVYGGSVATSFSVDSPEVTSLSVDLDSAGQGTITVGAQFNFTCDDCNQRAIDVYIGTERVAGGEFDPRVGTETYTVDVGCLPPGAYQVKAVARRCYVTYPNDPVMTDEETTSFSTPGTRGAVTVNHDEDAITGVMRLFGSYQLPPNAASAQLLVRQVDTFDENGVLVAGAILKDETVTAPAGSFQINPYTPPTGALQSVEIKATLSFCNGQADAVTAVPCGGCPFPRTATGDPVSFADGNMRYTEVDPLPPQLDALALARTYDTHHRFRSLFGRGWWSFMDARLVVHTAPGGDTIAMTTEANESVAFLRRNGTYTQLWPLGQRAPDTLTLDGSGFYVLRRQGGSVASLYRVIDGRFAGFRQMGTGREMRVVWSVEGLPLSVTDSWTALAWTIATDLVKRRITRITIGNLVWEYQYDANDNLLTVLAPGGAAWRSYEYISNRMTAARDAGGNLIESHQYSPGGAAIDSTGPNDEIQSIEYNVAGASGNDKIVRVTLKSGASIDYLLTPVGGAYRTTKVTGGCASCGLRDGVFAYDSEGHLTREQNASGYIAVHGYVAGRLVSTQSALKPAGCDPETSPTHCLLDPASLATATLESTPATLITNYEYADPAWPDRVTATVTPSITNEGELRREEYVYHASTGAVVLHTLRGWTNETIPAPEERSTLTTFYGDAANGFAPLFDPGGTFAASWLSLPQPAFARRSIDGPRTDVTDVTSLVYYPVDTSVPAALRGRLAAVRNAAGHITRYEDYDVFGNPLRVVDPNGVATEMTYDAAGRMLTSTVKGDPGCNTTFDSICGMDLTTTRTYSSVGGSLQSEQRPGGGVTTYGYDSRGRVVSISRGFSTTDLRERIETTYDPLTGKKSLERLLANENGTWVEKSRESFSYDSLGRLQTITHPVTPSDTAATFISYAYDEEGRLASVRDENHASPNTFYTYDPAGRSKTVKQTLAGAPGGFVTTHYSYDIHGNLTSVTDPNGNVTSYGFDDFGEVVRQESPVSGTTTYTYDLAGNLSSTVDANGASTARAYDALNRVVASTSALGSAIEAVIWTYDAALPGRFAIGRAATMTDPAGSTAYMYERRGLLREETRTFAGPGASSTTKFQYDRDGNRTSILYPSQRLEARYTFDYTGRPIATGSAITSATYLPFGPLTKLQFGNGTTQVFEYDARYRLTKNELTKDNLPPGQGRLARYTYAYDAAGNILNIQDTLDAEFHRHFAYDDLNRLITANTGPNPNPNQPSGTALWGKGSYTWDAMGNILAFKLGEIEKGPDDGLRRPPKPPTTEVNVPLGRSSSFTYLGTTPVLETVTTNDLTRGISHDAAGNETSYFVDRAYSPRNLLTKVIDTSEPEQIERHSVTYSYDGRGIRVIRAETPNNGAMPRRYYTYSPELQLLSVTADDAPNVWEASAAREFVWFGDRPIAQITYLTPTQYDQDYTVADHLGRPFLQTSVAGDVEWRVEYEPFGNVYDVRAGNREDQPLRFPGQELASTWEGPEESYNIFRWYRAGWGRYTQSDPIGVLGTLRVNQQPSPLPSLFLSHLGVDGLPVLLRHFDGPFFEQAPGVPSNLYAYVDGNPVLSVDPMGLEAVLCTVFREHKKPIASPYGSLPGNNCRFTGTCGGGPSGEIYKFDKSDPFIYRFIPPCKECPIACVFMWETSVGKLLTNPPLCYGKVPVDNKRGSPGSHGKGAGGGW